MNTHRFLVHAALLGLLTGMVSAQTPPAPAKPDPKVKEQLDQFRKLVMDRKGKHDAECKEIIDNLLKGFEKMHPKDQADYTKGIAVCLASTRCKRDATNDGIYRTTIFALGRTGKFGGKHLATAFKNKKYKKKEWLGLRGLMLEHLGRTKDPKQIDFLLDTALRSPDDALMAKAGGALQHFADEKLAVRKQIAKKLIKKFANIYTNANADLDPGNAVTKSWRDRLSMVSDPWNVSLQKLTKQHLRAPNAWNTFWNKNKGKNWDKVKTTKKR